MHATSINEITLLAFQHISFRTPALVLWTCLQ